MIVEYDTAPGGRALALVIKTEHDGVSVMTGVHRQTQRRRQGGVRFVEHGSREELAHLAHGMSEKAAAAGVPIDGLKAMVLCPNGIPPGPDRRAEILAEHIRQAISVDPALIFGPDMGCPEDVLDRVSRKGLTRHVTGLTRAEGGLDIDANGLTAHGLFAALRCATNDQLEGKSATIQGFGAVGAPLGLSLHEAGCRVVAVSNIQGVLRDRNGIDVAALHSAWKQAGDDTLRLFANGNELLFSEGPDRLLNIATDIFVPAARTSVLATRDEISTLRCENRSVAAIEDYLRETGASIICEGANHPLSFEAERYAEAAGVTVLPDIIVNCGGMIGCYMELDHRDQLRSDRHAYDAALNDCRNRIDAIVAHNLQGLAEGESAAQLRRSAMAGS